MSKTIRNTVFLTWHKSLKYNIIATNKMEVLRSFPIASLLLPYCFPIASLLLPYYFPITSLLLPYCFPI
ncbi:MAG: hypothetical protein WCK09_19365, partial [Bacteroidota bacterium]